jgi:hypothetical protein
VLFRNTLEKTDEDAAAAKSRAIRVAAELKQRKEQTSVDEGDTIAKREHINKLIADIKSMEEGNKRLQGGALDKGPAGDRIKAFRGRGDRRYISALRIKGKRVLVLLDTSASMMDDDVVKVIRLRNEPEAARKLAPSGAVRSTWSVGERAAPRQQPVPGLRFQREGQAVVTDTTANGSIPTIRVHQQCAGRHAQHRPRRWHQPGQCLHRRAYHQPAAHQIILITDGCPRKVSVPPSPQVHQCATARSCSTMPPRP